MPGCGFVDKAKASAGGKKSKRGKLKITLLKEKMGVDNANLMLRQIEANIHYYINHNDEAMRFEATKAFADYYKPRKKDIEVTVKKLMLDV